MSYRVGLAFDLILIAFDVALAFWLIASGYYVIAIMPLLAIVFIAHVARQMYERDIRKHGRRRNTWRNPWT